MPEPPSAAFPLSWFLILHLMLDIKFEKILEFVQISFGTAQVHMCQTANILVNKSFLFKFLPSLSYPIPFVQIIVTFELTFLFVLLY